MFSSIYDAIMSLVSCRRCFGNIGYQALYDEPLGPCTTSESLAPFAGNKSTGFRFMLDSAEVGAFSPI